MRHMANEATPHTTPPDDFAPDWAERETMWQEEVGREVTRIAKNLSTPTGLDDFDRAWNLLARDRPNKPAHKCPLRRRLIKKFFHKLYEMNI